MSYVLFGDQNIQQNNIPNVPNIPNTTISDSNIPLIKSEPNDGTILFYCCPECDYKSEDVSMFQIHALERHPDSMTFFSRDGNGYQDNDEKEKSLWAKENVEDFQMHCCPHCSFRSKENVKCEKCESHVKEAQFDSKMSHQIKRERESFEYIQSYDDYGKYDDYGDYGNDYGNDYGEDY